jgi:hypothetical protein
MVIRQETESPSLERQIELTKPGAGVSDEEVLLKKAVLHLNGHILGFIFGIVGALIIFAATNWLVFKGGEVVGPHLGLLSQFFIGYDVTFAGSFIGAAYAFAFGYLGGLFIGWVYNAVVFLKNL